MMHVSSFMKFGKDL